jgi:hypothetical protein
MASGQAKRLLLREIIKNRIPLNPSRWSGDGHRNIAVILIANPTLLGQDSGEIKIGLAGVIQ